VDWRRFYDFRDVPVSPTLNLARRINTALALPLKTLPAFQGQEQMAALAVRNLLRGRLLGLPSGQAIAEFLGETALNAVGWIGTTIACELNSNE
jgi:hypothetical protein